MSENILFTSRCVQTGWGEKSGGGYFKLERPYITYYRTQKCSVGIIRTSLVIGKGYSLITVPSSKGYSDRTDLEASVSKTALLVAPASLPFLLKLLKKKVNSWINRMSMLRNTGIRATSVHASTVDASALIVWISAPSVVVTSLRVAFFLPKLSHKCPWKIGWYMHF